jgi:transcriptional regulator
MYVPPHFGEENVDALHRTMRAFPLATLVTTGPAGIEACHVPMLIDAEPRPLGTLVFHLARANTQWRAAGAAIETLAIFVGPDAYVSPGYYPTKTETGKVVPTWDYVAVHAYGTLTAFDDAPRLHALVSRLTSAHEAGRSEPWHVTDAPEAYIDGQLRGIVGLELSITRLIGSSKMSQNKSDADRRGVADALAASSNAEERATAALVSQFLEERRAPNETAS